MSMITDTVGYATVSVIVAAVVLTIARSLLGNPFDVAELLIVAIIILVVYLVTQLVLKRGESVLAPFCNSDSDAVHAYRCL
jgi:hypothetical protein